VRVLSSIRISPKILVDELKRLLPDLSQAPVPTTAIAQLPPREFMEELRRLSSQSTGVEPLAWTLADALSECADESVFEDLVNIIRDRRFGKARQMLPYALASVESAREQAIKVLLEVLPDKDVTSQVLAALAQMGAIEAIASIQDYSDSPVPLVRQTARRALRRLTAPVEERPSLVEQRPSLVEPDSTSQLNQISINFDLENLVVFLQRLASLVGNLGPSEIDRIEDGLLDMEPDEETTFQLPVVYRDVELPLQIEVYMSDEGAPDVNFCSSNAELVEAIGQLLAEEVN
jgi:HEAT repeat protein